MEINILDELLKNANHRVGAYVDTMVSCRKEFLEKNKEYGKTWLCYRPKSLVARMWNKGLRIRTVQDKKEQLIDDGIDKEFDAIYNYSIIALIVTKNIVNDSTYPVSPLELESKIEIEPLYKETADLCFDLFKKKDYDYSGAWVQMSISSIIDEIMVKLMRSLSHINAQKDIPVGDFKQKLSQEFMDVANYALFAAILIKAGVDPIA
jgi:hypothetical protein